MLPELWSAAAQTLLTEVEVPVAGLPWGWIVFGFMAQGLFAARMLVQWLATEKAKCSVVPPLFWWLSLIGGTSMVVYFIRRGDPVGICGQAFALLIYARNLWLIHRRVAADG